MPAWQSGGRHLHLLPCLVGALCSAPLPNLPASVSRLQAGQRPCRPAGPPVGRVLRCLAGRREVLRAHHGGGRSRLRQPILHQAAASLTARQRVQRPRGMQTGSLLGLQPCSVPCLLAWAEPQGHRRPRVQRLWHQLRGQPGAHLWPALPAPQVQDRGHR